jgi:hypothetical protein
MLVSGPVATSVTGWPAPRITRRANSTAPIGSTATVGSPNAGPSRPLSPWMPGAGRSWPCSGCARPAAMGTDVIPAAVQIRRAFSVVFGSVWLPATVVMPSRSIAGLAAASKIARASS